MKALLALLCFTTSFLYAQTIPVYIRVNQVGYLPADTKIAIAFSNKVVKGQFEVADKKSGSTLFTGKIVASKTPGYDSHKYYYELDFTALNQEGEFEIRIPSYQAVSSAFSIGKNAGGRLPRRRTEYTRQYVLVRNHKDAALA